MEIKTLIEILQKEASNEIQSKIIELFEKEMTHENYIKRRSRRYEISLDQENEQSFMIENVLANRQISIEERAYQNWLIEKLNEAIKQLNSNDQAIIDMLFYLGFTEKEAAEQLGIRQQSLNERKQRILRELRKKLKKFTD